MPLSMEKETNNLVPLGNKSKRYLIKYINLRPIEYQTVEKVKSADKDFSNMEPTMLYYDSAESGVTLTIGKDACYYHPNTKGIHWNEERQPFGYVGVKTV